MRNYDPGIKPLEIVDEMIFQAWDDGHIVEAIILDGLTWFTFGRIVCGYQAQNPDLHHLGKREFDPNEPLVYSNVPVERLDTDGTILLAVRIEGERHVDILPPREDQT